MFQNLKTNKPLIQLGNSNQSQLKQDACKLVKEVQKESKLWEKLSASQQRLSLKIKLQ